MMPVVSSSLANLPFYLVSASPRRKELLERLGLTPLVIPMDIAEHHDPSLSPEDLTMNLARQKMEAFLKTDNALNGPFCALTADTIVHIEGTHLGKPEDREEAQAMLRLLSGRIHRVSTAFALIIKERSFEEVVSTEVSFLPLSDRDISFYLDSGEWHDAAGAYKIQERGEIMINWIKGSWSNVMGLPISPIYAILRDNIFWGPPVSSV